MKITAESLIWNSARKKVLLNHKYEIVRYIHLSDTKEIKTFPTEKWKKHPTPELGLERTIRLLQRHMYPMGIQQTFSCQGGYISTGIACEAEPFLFRYQVLEFDGRDSRVRHGALARQCSVGSYWT